MKHLALISCPGQQDRDHRILELAEWMGISTRTLTISAGTAVDQLFAAIGGSECGVVISTEALASLRELSPPDVLQNLIETKCAKLLVFGVGRAPHQRDLFLWLTDGAISGLTSTKTHGSFRAPDNGRKFTRAFAGQTFTLKRPVEVSTFDLQNTVNGDVQRLLLADENPVFLRMEQGSCELFLLALARVPDINERLSRDRGVEEYYDQIVPLLIFLRHCFAESCWHGSQSTARLIIDDPLLDQTYGYLNYAALRDSMRSTGYGTSMAFIPWNHWRTSTKKAAGIFDQSTNISICVHGCDHTNREFEELDLDSLQWKADTALRRMERHQRRTNLAFDPVMVFPQGKFSTSAILALRTSGYLAAVNTTCFPTNVEAAPLTIADFLRPAITKFHGFPLFQRRYPRSLFDFAFDIFLGRPALIVQHHEDFRDGYRHLEEFVGGLRSLEPSLIWGSLPDRLMRTCMVRSISDQSTEVRFFTKRFTYTTDRSNGTNLVFSKEEPDASAISSVVVNGASVPFDFKNGLLIFEHRAGAGEVTDITVLDRPRSRTPTPKRFGVTHTVGVCVRRVLSEFRDKALTRHPRVLAAAARVATRMRVTGADDADQRAKP